VAVFATHNAHRLFGISSEVIASRDDGQHRV